MALNAGTRLGPYEIESLLGVGGMGEVYRAKDTRLGRQVALKVLPDGLTADAPHRARFQQEARSISALNHAHICALHDVGHESGVDYLVLELLEGETLSARLRRGPLALSQVIRLGRQIADALAAAHQHGVVHRDLKPANIMLTPAGAKLLDFGLAKAIVRPAYAPLAETVVGDGPATSAGVIVGTLQYMAPEQVQGLPADARTDIFALGAVLHEMATGQKAFEGVTAARLIASILEKETPPISNVVPLASPALAQVIDRCLAKDPGDRWQSAHDVKLQLEWLQSHGSGAVDQPQVTSSRRQRWLLPLAVVVIAALSALTAVLLMKARTSAAPPEARTMRFDVLLPEDTELQGAEPRDAPRFDIPEISPDGRRVAYAAVVNGRRQLLVREWPAREPTVLAGTEGAMLPFWSPDSRSLGFFAGGALKQIAIAGGAARTLAPAAAGQGGTWRPGLILFAPTRDGLIHRISDTGGTSTPLDTLPPERFGYQFPRFLPDGETFLVSAGGGLFVASLGVPGTRPVLDAGGPMAASALARYAQGHLLFLRGAQLLARPFDLQRLAFSGPEALIGDPARSLSASHDGTVVYHAQPPPSTQLTWFARNGDRTGTLADPAQDTGMALAPSGRRAAVWRSDGAGNTDIWEVDLTTGVLMRLTDDPALDSDALWSADERRLAFTSFRSGRGAVYVKDLVTREEKNVSTLDAPMVVDAWGPDGRSVVARATRRGVYLVPVDGERVTRHLVRTEFVMDELSVSPDGHWIAFNSMESGDWEVYIAAFPDFTSKRQVSLGGGVQPHWRGDGKELFYLRRDAAMMSVPLTEGPGSAIVAGSPVRLFSTDFSADPHLCQYGVTPDGQRFLGLSRGERRRDTFTVLLNWLTPSHSARQ